MISHSILSETKLPVIYIGNPVRIFFHQSITARFIVVSTIFLLLQFGGIHRLYAQETDNPSTQSQVQPNSVARINIDTAGISNSSPNTTIWLHLNLTLNPNWHVYWKNPGQSGMPPTLLIQSNVPLETGEILYSPPKRIFVAHLVNYGYENTADFFIPVSLTNLVDTKEIRIDIKADWLICEEDCIPEAASFNFLIPVGDQTVRSEQYSDIHSRIATIHQIPQLEVKAQLGKKLVLSASQERTGSINDIYAFIEQQGSITLSQRQNFKSEQNEFSIEIEPESLSVSDKISGYLEITHSNLAGTQQQSIYRFETLVNPFDTKQSFDLDTNLNLYTALLFAFLGGMLLNLMPCVFPILSLKVLSLLRTRNMPKFHQIHHALSYTSGILLSFFAIAIIIIILQAAGVAVGWGLQMQSPLFLWFMLYILIWVALVLMGTIQIWLPIPDALNQHHAKHPLTESFMTGLLITLISTPCTAPLMAPALGFAFTQSPLEIMVILLSLGLGLAFPFIVIALIPALSKWIPASGPWLNTFKEFLAFPMLFTALWLAWILQKHIQANDFILVLAGLICFTMLVWLKKQHLKYSVLRFFLYILLSIPIVYSAAKILDTQQSGSPSIAQPFSIAQLEQLQRQGKKIFVNVTADWCINCKANEALVLSTPEIKQYFQNKNVIYLTADWTKQDETIGKYLATFNRFGVPLYVYYPASGEPVILPQLLTKEIIYTHVK